MAEYIHKYIDGLSCVIVSPTNKGYKVEQTMIKGRKSKTITAFYSHIDFDPQKGIWNPKPTA